MEKTKEEGKKGYEEKGGHETHHHQHQHVHTHHHEHHGDKDSEENEHETKEHNKEDIMGKEKKGEEAKSEKKTLGATLYDRKAKKAPTAGSAEKQA